MRVLIANDTAELTAAVRYTLIGRGYETDCVYDGGNALKKAATGEYDVILLSAAVAKPSEFKILKKLRTANCKTALIIIGAESDTADKVRALELGADDYLQTPFNMNELTARISAVTRCKQKSLNRTSLYYADICLDLSENRLINGNLEIRLSQNEGELLKHLITGSEIVVPTDRLLEACSFSNGEKEALDKIADLLQKNLENVKSKVKIIFIKGVGYKICC